MADDPRQACFEFVEPVKYDLMLVGETPEGYGLYRRLEGHGGYSYFTDEYGTGHMVYDEGITNLISTFAALDDLGEGHRLWKHIGVVFGYDLSVREAFHKKNIGAILAQRNTLNGGKALLDVSRIDHDDLSKGAKVFYKYAKEEGDPRGPVTVKLRSRDHEGSFVIVTFGSDERKLYLADDEDYGALSFYVRN